MTRQKRPIRLSDKRGGGFRERGATYFQSENLGGGVVLNLKSKFMGALI